MMVAIHQPNFIPWLGFFDKMRKSDVFILLDTVPFTKGGFQNRVKICNSSNPSWLTIPVITKGKLGQKTNEVMIDHRKNWKDKHLKSLEQNYGKCDGSEVLLRALKSAYGKDFDRLSDFNSCLIELLCKELDIKTKIVKASSLNVNGSRSELLLNLVSAIGGGAYLSGKSGVNYLDESIFDSRNIDVQYHSFRVCEYPQRSNLFIKGLSAIDYLFNEPSLENWTIDKNQESSC